MANIMTKTGEQDNVITYEHFCDNVSDMKNIPSERITLGSKCVVINGTNGISIYIADSNKQWHII